MVINLLSNSLQVGAEVGESIRATHEMNLVHGSVSTNHVQLTKAGTARMSGMRRLHRFRPGVDLLAVLWW